MTVPLRALTVLTSCTGYFFGQPVVISLNQTRGVALPNGGCVGVRSIENHLNIHRPPAPDVPGERIRQYQTGIEAALTDRLLEFAIRIVNSRSHGSSYSR